MSLSSITTRSKLLGVGVLCAAGGVGAGAVATATASTGASHTKAAHHARHHAKRGRDMRELRAVARHSAQGSVVVHTKDGYKTITFERGIVDSVNGNQLTLAEGTKKDAYKTVTITVPSGARVRDNGKKASMSSVSAGQHVLIVQMPKRTLVEAHTAHHRAHSSTRSAA